MFKCLWILLGLVAIAKSQAPPPNSVVLQMLGDKAKFPDTSVTNDVTVDSLTLVDCLDAAVYNSEEAVADIDTEEEYLCAFISFQFNKDDEYGLPNYTDEAEATERYPLFKKCVDSVNQWNSETDETVFEVNFFCDMKPEEKRNYYGAHYENKDDGESFGLGSPNDQPISNNILMQLFGDMFTMPDPSVAGELTLDDLTLDDCTLTSVYDTETVIAQIDEEQEYLCAFVAFQINKVDGEGIPRYSDQAEATKRYPLFKKCVDYVKELNEEADETEFGVNFFCDMTTEEKDPYSSAEGDYDHFGEFGIGSSYDGGESEKDAAVMSEASFLVISVAVANAMFVF